MNDLQTSKEVSLKPLDTNGRQINEPDGACAKEQAR